MAEKKTASTTTGNKATTATAMGIQIEDRKYISLRARGRGFAFWIIGLIVSLAPLVVVHFGECINGNASFFLNLFGDVEIFFICVCMLVSASCEANAQRKRRNLLSGIILVCIVFFALFYSEFNDTTLTDAAKSTISIVTCVSLVITLLLGAIAYFNKRR